MAEAISISPQMIPDEAFAHLKHYLMFVGSARSGHSVFGAILDAHPRIMLGNELHALPLFQRSSDRLEVFRRVLAGAIETGGESRWNNTGYDYNIAGLSQGRCERLEVLGDKKAGQSSVYTLKLPGVPQRMLKLLGPMLKVLMVQRNPFDTITAMSHHKKLPIDAKLIERYFKRLDGALMWKSALPAEQFMIVRHEDLIADKTGTILRLCAFVGQTTTAEYLDRCAAMVYESPNKRRHSAPWSDEHKSLVARRIGVEPYREALAGYAF